MKFSLSSRHLDRRPKQLVPGQGPAVQWTDPSGQEEDDLQRSERQPQNQSECDQSEWFWFFNYRCISKLYFEYVSRSIQMLIPFCTDSFCMLCRFNWKKNKCSILLFHSNMCEKKFVWKKWFSLENSAFCRMCRRACSKRSLSCNPFSVFPS